MRESDQGWRKSLRGARHVDGTTEDYVDHGAAGQRQIEPLADLNNPASKKRETPISQPPSFRPGVKTRPITLSSELQPKNLLP